jgi:hypothetical protein
MEKIIIDILLILLVVALVGGSIAIALSGLYIKVDLHFLSLKLDDHPLLIQKLDDVVKFICEKEKLKVFHIPYDVMNEKVDDPDKKAIGKYVYSTSPNDYKKTLAEVQADIQETEKKYGRSYDELCISAGVKPIRKERFYIPRIMMCEENEKYGSAESYYGTLFHELGHHFVVKKIGAIEEHDEKDADKSAAELIKEYLPHYYLLFFWFGYRFRETGVTLTSREKFKAIIKFLLFLRKERNISKKKNVSQ